MECRASGWNLYLSGPAKGYLSYRRREDFDDMDMWNAPVLQSRQPLTYRLMESVGLGGPKWHGSSWQRGIAESGSSWLSTLMTDVPGDLVSDLPCVQQASYLEGGPLMWMLPLYLHVNQNPIMMMIWWYLSYRVDTKSFSNKTTGGNSKSKNARVVNFVCDMSTHPDLHFYQVSSK